MAKLRIGSLIAEKKKSQSGQEYTTVFLGLGNDRNKDPKYNTTVELTVRDHLGNVIHSQKNGFVSLVDPRTEPDELLSAGIISQERADQMKDRLSNLPDKIKYTLQLNTKPTTNASNR